MTHKLQELIDGLIRRDADATSDINQNGIRNIDHRIDFVNGRAVDALQGVILLARYILESEKASIEKEAGNDDTKHIDR